MKVKDTRPIPILENNINFKDKYSMSDDNKNKMYVGHQYRIECVDFL